MREVEYARLVGDFQHSVHALQHGLDVRVADGLTVALDPGDAVDPAVAGLTALLVEAAVPVFAVGPRAQSLEDIYRRVATAPKRQQEAA